MSAEAENHEMSSADSDDDRYEEPEDHQMPFSVEEIISRSKPIFTEIGISNVYLFGSYAKDRARESSNVDF
jgi:predicted nucleotidyltransferase